MADGTDLERGVDNMKNEAYGVGDIDWERIDDIDEAIDEDGVGLVAGRHVHKEVQARELYFEALRSVRFVCLLACWD